MTTNANIITNIEWNNGLASRSRRPWLLLIKGEEIKAFGGETIQGWVVVRGSDYNKNGKWSSTTYRLTLAKGVRHIAGYAGWETGLFVEGLGRAVGKATPDTWSDLADCLGVSVPAAMTFIRGWRSKTAEAMDKVEADLAALDDDSGGDNDTEIVTVSFGSPTNRAIRDGYWEKPKPIPDYEAEIRLICPNGGWNKDNIEIVGIAGKVLSVTHSSGMHGGYYAVSVAVIPGTETEIPSFKTRRQEVAEASGLPEELFHAFSGDEDRVRQFMENVRNLDGNRLDAHEMSCGRDRKRAEVIRVSKDPEFFLGADPKVVCDYIEEIHGSSYGSVVDARDNTRPVHVETPPAPANSGLADALRNAGLGNK